jgi:outer membrane receptor for ferrienterochelin and colicin
MTEIGFSGESTFNTVIADVHRLIAGIKFERINVGPDLRTQYSPDMSDTNNLGYLYVITLKPAIDDTMSAYVEDNYDITDKLTLVAGLSYAYNDLREVGGDFMPRASVIYQLTDEWSGKYAYNTGYGRPPVMKKLGIYYGHATESEKTNEHDLQLAYNNRQFRMTVTGFNYNINDYFTWYDDGIKDPVTGVDMNSGDFNKGNATSTGVEFDSRGYIGKIFSIYASFEYANTIVNHALSVGEPKDVYNAGLDWYIVKDLSANLNVNGFIDMFHGYDASGNAMFWSGATEQIVDLSVIAENILNRYDLTVYCNNVLNNKVHVGMTGWPGYTYLGGVSVGVKLAASF